MNIFHLPVFIVFLLRKKNTSFSTCAFLNTFFILLRGGFLIHHYTNIVMLIYCELFYFFNIFIGLLITS